MVNPIRRIMLMGVGAMSLTRERVEQFVSDSIARGELTSEQGKSLMEDWGRRAEERQAQLETMVRQQVERAINLAGLAPRSEVVRLEARLNALADRLHHLTVSPSGSTRPASDAAWPRGGEPVRSSNGSDASPGAPVPETTRAEVPGGILLESGAEGPEAAPRGSINRGIDGD
jgi:polyhydroxyalkanoate synthesis regulator phasin